MKKKHLTGWAALAVGVGVVVGVFWFRENIFDAMDWRVTVHPLGRTVMAADVLGTWRYRSEGPAQVVEIEVRGDGTYEQRVYAPAGASTLPAVQVQGGRWECKNDEYQTFYAHGVLMKQVGGNWLPEDGLGWWRVGKSKKRPGEAAIFGGDFPDPDGWREFEKVK